MSFILYLVTCTVSPSPATAPEAMQNAIRIRTAVVPSLVMVLLLGRGSRGTEYYPQSVRLDRYGSIVAALQRVHPIRSTAPPTSMLPRKPNVHRSASNPS